MTAVQKCTPFGHWSRRRSALPHRLMQPPRRSFSVPAAKRPIFRALFAILLATEFKVYSKKKNYRQFLGMTALERLTYQAGLANPIGSVAERSGILSRLGSRRGPIVSSTSKPA